MKIITWNVNGIRSVSTKEKDGTKHSKPIEHNVVRTILEEYSPDILCLQEIKCDDAINIPALVGGLDDLGYVKIDTNCSTSKKGYSGVCMICKQRPMNVIQGFGTFAPHPTLNNEGRVISAEFDKYVVVNVYTPNSKPDLSRLDFRVNTWDVAFRNFIAHLQQTTKKHIIVCGDLNVAPAEIDLSNPNANKKSHGFTIEERQTFKALLETCNLIDSFRHLHPSHVKFSWFSPFAKSRERNKGWRIDHVLVSKKLAPKIQTSEILHDYFGSDHVPCMCEIMI